MSIETEIRNVDSEIKYIVKKISWGSILAGVITVMAISILLSTLGTALGFSMVEPFDRDPVAGVGTSVVVWSTLSILFSLFCGGYLAGRLATNAGMIHGFLVWAISLLLAALFGGMLLSGAVKATGNALSTAASATGNVVSGVGSAAANNASGIAQAGERFFNNMSIDTNLPMPRMSREVYQSLRSSNIPSLQPEFMQNQLEGAKNDITAAIRQIAASSDDMDNVVKTLVDKLKNRNQALNQDIDRNALVRALAQNTSLSQDEINQTANNIIENRDRTAAIINQRLNNAEQQILQASQQYEQFKQQALKKADEAAAALAKAALMSFIALLIGCLVSSYAGVMGVKRFYSRYPKRVETFDRNVEERFEPVERNVKPIDRDDN